MNFNIKYPGLIHCRRCDAQYRESDNWCMGYYTSGTSGYFNPISRIPREHCPICHKPPLLDVPNNNNTAM